jgi:hypothetical protein
MWRVEAGMTDELPVEGFPISAEAVQAWFVDRHGRLPGAAELTGILNAMAAREATAPVAAENRLFSPHDAGDEGNGAGGAA